MPHAANWMASGNTPALLGSAHPNIAPYDKFACRDGEIFLGILNDRQFRRFCEHLDLQGLPADPRFASNSARLSNRDGLRTLLETALAMRTRDSVCSDLMSQGVPVGPVNNVPQAFEQAHASHRQMLVDEDGRRQVGIPTRLSRTPGRVSGAPPAFAQHTDDVLRESGVDPARIAQWRASGALPGRRRR